MNPRLTTLLLLAIALPGFSATVVDSSFIESMAKYASNNATLALVYAQVESYKTVNWRTDVSIWVDSTIPGSTIQASSIRTKLPISTKENLQKYGESLLSRETLAWHRDLYVHLIEYARTRQVLAIDRERLHWIILKVEALESRSSFQPVHAALMKVQNRRDETQNDLITTTNQIGTLTAKLRRLLGDPTHQFSNYELQLPRPTKPLIANQKLLLACKRLNPDLAIAHRLTHLADDGSNSLTRFLRAGATDIEARLPEVLTDLASKLDASERLARSLRDERLIREEESLSLANAGIKSGRITLSELIDHHLEISASRIQYLEALATHHKALAELNFTCGVSSIDALRALLIKENAIQ
jgi:hypothetical protein